MIYLFEYSDIISDKQMVGERGKEMAKIYQFSQCKREKETKALLNRAAPDKDLICHLIDTLILTYKKRIEELETYKKEIAKENGRIFKSPRELLKGVRIMQQMLLGYGISCNFFRFYTLRSLEVIYYNETSLIYVVEQAEHNKGMTYSMGEFITAFEGYHFQLNLDQALFNIFNKQIDNLKITIETLDHTEV